MEILKEKISKILFACFRFLESNRYSMRQINKRKTTRVFRFFIVTVTCIFLWKYFPKPNVIFSSSSLFESENDNQIPSIVHFVLGQGDRKDVEHRYALSSSFSFINYLNVLAARRQIRPKKLYVHYYEEPDTFWWNQTKQDREIDVTLVKTSLVENIFRKSVNHHAHRGDIIRLEVVVKYGGIYLDTDVLALRSFDPLFNLSDVVMAHQDDDSNTACNAVIMSKKNAVFLRRLYDAYQSFDRTRWDQHSVRIPGQLALVYPNEVMVLPTSTFFRPSWSEVNKFFDSNDYNFSSNYASHLWNKMHVARLNALTPDRILDENFTLARMLLHAIGKETIHKLKKFFPKNASG
jgi:mannosyltransferase OCH1-like enzyme